MLNFLKNIVVTKKKYLFGVVILLVAGVLVWKFVIAPKNGKKETTTVARGTVVEELILSGQVKATKDVDLSFGTSGEIAWIGVTEGDSVKKGQAVAKLDTTTLNSAYQSARASLRLYEATVDKVHDDVKDHSSDETWTQRDTRTTAEATKDKAYEAVVQAEEALKNATLLAPFEGKVTYLGDFFPGLNVLYTDTIMEIVDPTTIYFDVSADQNEVVGLFLGQKVNVVLDSFPETEMSGEVIYIGLTPKAGETGAVYRVRVKFNPENENQIKVGMTGDAKFVVSEVDDTLYIPPKFLNSDIKGKYLKTNGNNGRVYVTVGAEGEERIEISGDIKEGDIVYE